MVGELFVIDTHQMKNRGVVVVHMTWSVGRRNPVFVGFPVGYPIGYPSPDATAGEDARECVGARFTTDEVVRDRCLASVVIKRLDMGRSTGEKHDE
jgi:hypothetical protein